MVSDQSLKDWLDTWVRMESVSLPHVSVVTRTTISFVFQMYQMFNGIDMKTATQTEKQIFKGLCQFMEMLNEVRSEYEPLGITKARIIQP